MPDQQTNQGLDPHSIQANIRNTVLAALNKLPKAQCNQASAIACALVQKHSAFQTAQKIASYQAIQAEIDLAACQNNTHPEKKFYAPILHTSPKPMLHFGPATPSTQWIKNPFGIDEPDTPLEQTARAEDLDLIIVPLVAVDPQGNRIGRGKGYYDRTLASLLNTRPKRPFLLGVCHACQMVPAIPPQPWDVPLDDIIVIPD